MGTRYHQWVRAQGSGQSDPSLTPPGVVGGAWRVAFTRGAHDSSDVVERVFADFQLMGTMRIDPAALSPQNWAYATFFPTVCVGIVDQGSGAVPNPIDGLGPQTNIVLTGALELVSAEFQTAIPDPPFQDFICQWRGSFESQGSRKAPIAGFLPEAVATMHVYDPDLMGGGPPAFGVATWWRWTCYLRTLLSSSLPFV